MSLSRGSMGKGRGVKSEGGRRLEGVLHVGLLCNQLKVLNVTLIH